jgi:hypothetical protein
MLLSILHAPYHVNFLPPVGLSIQQQFDPPSQLPIPKFHQSAPNVLYVQLSLFVVDCICEVEAFEFETDNPNAKQI